MAPPPGRLHHGSGDTDSRRALALEIGKSVETEMSLVRKATATGFLSLALLGVAAPAQAQPQRGLVNVNIEDVLTRNAVGVGVAANVIAEVCGVVVNANVLAEQVVRDGGTFETTCDARADAPVTVTPSA
jgi:acetylornithine deacetylase/succinyl-diaminopimelate desuccinylase-like protein